jgi:segregation and condensation protein A
MNSSSDPLSSDPLVPGPPGDGPADGLILHLDGFEGPLDLLLELARAQKVDLARISILALVEQYLAVIEGARRVRLELAADWLVMAAWLTWLKSRLLLPAGSDASEEGEDAALVLAARLQDLLAIRAAAGWLGARPMLGRDVFARGAPEDHTEIDRSGLLLGLPALLRAYLAALRRGGGKRRYRPRPLTIWTVQDALARLRLLLGSLPDGASLEQFLPDFAASPVERRAALASTLLAGLELARDGAVRLDQDRPFGPLLLRPAPPAAPPP